MNKKYYVIKAENGGYYDPMSAAWTSVRKNADTWDSREGAEEALEAHRSEFDEDAWLEGARVVCVRTKTREGLRKRIAEGVRAVARRNTEDDNNDYWQGYYQAVWNIAADIENGVFG